MFNHSSLSSETLKFYFEQSHISYLFVKLFDWWFCPSLDWSSVRHGINYVFALLFIDFPSCNMYLLFSRYAWICAFSKTHCYRVNTEFQGALILPHLVILCICTVFVPWFFHICPSQLEPGLGDLKTGLMKQGMVGMGIFGFTTFRLKDTAKW